MDGPTFGTRTAGAANTAAPEVPAIGTWYLNANYLGDTNNFFLTATITGGSAPGVYQGTLINEHGTVEILDNITWDDSGGQLEFRRNGQGFWQWYRGTVVEGVLIGRFSHDTNSPQKPAQLASFSYHVTGWNSTVLDRDIVPRSYDLVINTNSFARLRIDRLPSGQFVGRLKVYATQTGQASAEEPEYDLEVTRWDGTHLSFTKHGPHWTQEYTGLANGRSITGTFTQTGTQNTGSWQGTRTGVLSHGLVRKASAERATWQDRTRRILYHLMMAGNPLPVTSSVDQQAIAVSDSPGGVDRDDNPQAWPQNYPVTELHFHYTLPNPYGGSAIVRESHGYLAVPNSPPPGGKYRAVLALNGHGGSAWQVMNPDAGGIYWYGNAFARRGYVVLALDMSHRPAEDSKPLYEDFYNAGDDPGHGNGPHPAIKAPGFDSDWAEDGERAWDAMRALDYLLSLPNIDTNAVLVTGLSMGGEMTTVVAALDLRLAGSIPAGFSPDLDVVYYHLNHRCWRWIYANIREYIDTSDLHALIAPRTLIVETGKQDQTYSDLSTPFAADKQVARRSRMAYGSEVKKFVHYLHYEKHEYHVGDVDPQNPNAERGVHIPTITEPQAPFSLTWQIDPTTIVVEPTLFDYLDFLLQYNPGTILYAVEDAPNARFGDWASLGGDSLQQLVAGGNADGRLQLFALDEDGAAYQTWQDMPNGTFGPLNSLGGHDIRQLAVARNSDGRLQLFALGGDGAVYQTWQNAPNGTFGPWSGLGGHDIRQLVSGSNADGRLQLFALGGDDAVYQTWQNVANGTFGPWSGLGGHSLQELAVGMNADGRLQLFALGGDGAVYQTWQDRPNGVFGPWSGLGGHDIRQLAVATNADGRLQLFALGGDGAVYQTWQNVANGVFGPWSGLGGHDIQQLAVGRNADGRLQLFALGGDGAAYQTWQNIANGVFGPWSGLGGRSLGQLTVGTNADGRLEIFSVQQ